MAQSTILVPQNSSTIQAAIDRAQDGDTVLVSPGTYRETLTISGKSITVTSGAKTYQEASATVIQGDSSSPVVTIKGTTSAETLFNGFTVQGGNASDPAACGGITVSGAAPTLTNNVVTSNQACGLGIDTGASPTVKDNDIKSNLGNGVLISTAGNVVLISNVIEGNVVPNSVASANNEGAGFVVRANNTTSSVPAVSLTLDHNVIRNNVSDSVAAFSQQIGSAIQTLILTNNEFYGNVPRGPYSDIQIYLSGPYSLPGQNVRTQLTEINNTIVGGGESLVLNFGTSVIANNLFFNMTAPFPTAPVGFAGLSCSSQYETVLVDIHNNDIFNVGPPSNGGCKLGEKNLSVDPQLRDIANGDLHEQSGSPLVAAGDITAPLIPTADLDNKARTVCGTIDIGAYELRPHPLIALTSSANPTPGGGTITFTARLTGNCNVPRGVVTFLDGGVVIGTGTLDSSGVATLATSFLVVGQHNITATYPGDFNFDESTSSVLVQIITGDPTATALNVSPNPQTAFAPISLSSVMSSQYGTPTGSVVFRAGTQILATAPLDGNGRAAATISSLGAGTYAITANYTADTRFQPSTSAVVQEVVIGANSITSLSAAPNPAFVSQPVAFNVNVRAAQGNNVPTGSISLTDGGANLGTATINNGVATFTTSALSVGAHPITARYSGSSDFNTSSASLTEVINIIGTSLSLRASPNPANGGQAVTLTVTATASLLGTVPVGAVTFRDGATVLGTVALDAGGTASFTTSSLAVGTHQLQAVYGGNASFGPSSSPVISQLIQSYDFSLSLSKGSLTLPSEDWSRMTVTVTPIGGFQGDVALSCADLPDHAQCVFDAGSVVSLAKGVQQIQFVVNTSDVYRYGSSISAARSPWQSHGRLVLAVGFPIFGLLGFTRRRAWTRASLMTGIILACLVGLQGCSGKLPAGAAPGNYAVSLVGVSNDATALRHSSALTLTVTPKR